MDLCLSCRAMLTFAELWNASTEVERRAALREACDEGDEGLRECCCGERLALVQTKEVMQ